MVVSVVCTVVLGLVALYQTWTSRCHRDAAVSYRAALFATSAALEYQRDMNKHVMSTLDDMSRAARQGDIMKMIEVLKRANDEVPRVPHA